mgnify:CR=1 FL=1
MTMSGLDKWYGYMKSHDTVALWDLLHPDAVFESPVVHTPQRGRDITFKYLASAEKVLGGPGFKYTGEWRNARGAVLESSRDTREYLKACLRDQTHEVFCGLFLDNRHRVIAFEELFAGTLNGTAVYPREVVKHALRHNAAAVIFAHNHPSGVAEPSRADEVLTARLKEALALVDIRVLDHVVIGDGDMVSFSERGLL